MRIREYRIVLPMSYAEFEIGGRYTEVQLAEERRNGRVVHKSTFDGGDISLFFNHKFSGQHMRKVYNLQTQIWGIPKNMRIFEEHCWKCTEIPYVRTELSNKRYMGKKFIMRTETVFVDGDRGNTKNVFQLSQSELEKRDVVHIDIADDNVFLSRSQRRELTDKQKPSLLRTKAGRGPLKNNWTQRCEPRVMCAYKLVTVNFECLGLQSIVERYLLKRFPGPVFHFYRRVYCTMDEWYNLTLDRVQKLEVLLQREMDGIRKCERERARAEKKRDRDGTKRLMLDKSDME